MEQITVETLASMKKKLTGFVRARINDPEFADDLLQDTFLKALRAAPALEQQDKLIPWFYRILRNAIVDHYRQSKHRIEPASVVEADEVAMPDAEVQELCDCFYELIPALKKEYAELIRELDLEGTSAEVVSERLGISRNNLKVRHHRARQALRQRLEETCRLCATHGCLDCTCRESGRST